MIEKQGKIRYLKHTILKVYKDRGQHSRKLEAVFARSLQEEQDSLS